MKLQDQRHFIIVTKLWQLSYLLSNEDYKFSILSSLWTYLDNGIRVEKRIEHENTWKITTYENNFYTSRKLKKHNVSVQREIVGFDVQILY